MKIAICSNIHDNLTALEKALIGMRAAQAKMLLFCGDFNAPFTLNAMAQGFSGPIHIVWGNNDGDKWLLTKIAQRYAQVTLHGIFAEIEEDGYKIAVVHYNKLGNALARSDLYDLVCYGHDHTASHEYIGDTLLLNPGELMGRFGAPTYAIVDSATAQVAMHEL